MSTEASLQFEQSECVFCKDVHSFEMPPGLVDAALRGDLVIFAGAGISTESRLVYEDTLYERISWELGEADRSLSFPEVMSLYSQRYGRPQLLQRIRSRFDYLKTFPELRRIATRFHQELATAYYLHDIITTNWDTFFEDHAAATPIVVPEDYAFWSLPGRKVFKLHGSMHNLSTIVATTSDYERCYRRLRDGAIGGTLRHLLATKQMVFIGYSFGDPDLNRILRFLRREMSDVLPRSYVVTPHGGPPVGFPADHLIPTDGTHFISELKAAAVERGVARTDEVYDRVARLLERLLRAHHRTARIRASDTPSVVHALAYQDGMRHALERILSLRSTGQDSNPHQNEHLLPRYESARRGAIRKRRYFDAAYIEGYWNGLFTLEVDDDAELRRAPLFFVWGSGDLVEFGEFTEALAQAPTLHKAATAQAARLAQNLGPHLIPKHGPFLDMDAYIEASGA